MNDPAADVDELTSLHLVGFGGAANLPIWIAQDAGLYDGERLQVHLDVTSGSIAQMQNLMAGRYQIATTAIDNIIAYGEGQGDVVIDPFDVFAFLGVHFGLNSLVARPEIESFADIKGKTVAVDALGAGYAFLLFGILGKHGLVAGRDYEILGVGGGPARLDALVAGKAAAAVMSAPNDIQARAMGFKLLADASEAIGRYQGSVYAARRDWADAHPEIMVRFARATMAAHAMVFADKTIAIQTLRRRLGALSEAAAEQIYARLTSAPGGLSPAADIDLEGLRTVVALRHRYARGSYIPIDPGKYVDLRFREEARRS